MEGEEGATLVVELPVPPEVVEAASSILGPAVASCWEEVLQVTQIAEDAVVGVALPGGVMAGHGEVVAGSAKKVDHPLA